MCYSFYMKLPAHDALLLQNSQRTAALTREMFSTSIGAYLMPGEHGIGWLHVFTSVCHIEALSCRFRTMKYENSLSSDE